MLIAFSQIDGTTLEGISESIGTIKDVFVDQQEWGVRYLVVDTGRWLSGRKVLVSPAALTACDWGAHSASARLTQQQVEASPDVDLMKPVSRQMEYELAKHYDWPAYWAGGVGVSIGGGASAVPPAAVVPEEQQHEIEDELPNVRSVHEMLGYDIVAADGEIGHVEELIVDDEGWVVRYLVIDTKNWLPGRKVLVSPQWIESVSWVDQSVSVDLLRQSIKESPEYDPLTPVNRGYEEHLYDYYGKKRYWLP